MSILSDVPELLNRYILADPYATEVMPGRVEQNSGSKVRAFKSSSARSTMAELHKDSKRIESLRA